jgi:CubicO group peptidase (beta-lactamase class C family)
MHAQGGQVRARNFQEPEHSKWGFHHVRNLHPTACVWRGSEGAIPFNEAPADLGGVTFDTAAGTSISVAEMIASHYTDGFLVLHRGSIVMEYYGHAMRPRDPHILMSTTKSFAGSLASILIAQGVLDESLLVTDALPSLADTAYRNVTVRHLLDMRVGLDFSEDYDDPNCDFAYLDAASGWRPLVHAGAPDNLLDFMKTVRPKPPHGGKFHYVSANSVVLGWVLEAVSGQRFAELLSELIWQPIRAEYDADLVLDNCGLSQTEGGLNVSLRDLARFGELHRCEGSLHGRQIIAPEWIADLRHNGDTDAWDAGEMSASLPGHHYRSQWYTHCTHPNRPFFTLGAFGQTVYVDPVAEVVVAKLSCHPGGVQDTPFDKPLRAFRAIADALSQE